MFWFPVCVMLCLISHPHFILFAFVSHSRQALFGDHVKKPQSLEDSDLSRLYMATSLMQIDDNVMRYVPTCSGMGPGGRPQASGPRARVFLCSL